MIRKSIFGLVTILWLAGCGMMSGTLPEQPTALPTFALVASATPDPVSASATQASAATPAGPEPAATPVPALGGKASGDLRVWIFSNPNPPVRGANTLEALVTDANGQPITDAALSFDIDMTNMSHGKNVVTASALGEGRYSGEVHFLMPGPWRVIVGIDRAGQTSTVRFDFMVSR